MSRRKDPSKGNPRTGDGVKAKGKKPSEIGTLQMRSTYAGYKSGVHASGVRREQPKGWGIARVVDIFTRKERS